MDMDARVSSSSSSSRAVSVEGSTTPMLLSVSDTHGTYGEERNRVVGRGRSKSPLRALDDVSEYPISERGMSTIPPSSLLGPPASVNAAILASGLVQVQEARELNPLEKQILIPDSIECVEIADEQSNIDNFEIASRGKKPISYRSLYLFTRENRFRRCLIRLVENKWFDRFILLTILANCVFLALYRPLESPESSMNSFLGTAEIVITCIFTLEAILKIIAFGFVFDTGSYLRNAWNVFDFIIVIVSWISVFLGTNLSVLRTLRVFRPLRSITGFSGARAMVITLFRSLPLLLDVFILCFFVFITFALLGTVLFQGAVSRRCFDSSLDEFVNTDRPCGGEFQCGPNQECREFGNLRNGLVHFDNIGAALLIVYQCVTLSEWPTVMMEFADATTIWVSLFFIALIFLSAFFAMNLALVVVVEAFRTASEDVDKELRDSTDSQSDLLMEESRERIESEKSGVEIHRSTVESINADTDGSNLSCFRRFFFMILQHWSFDFCITLAILVNTLLLSLYYHDMPNSMLNDLELGNLVLTIIFIVEMVVKLLGLGFRGYLSSKMNIFDLIIVLISIIELSISGSGAISAVRAFRIFRIFKLARSWSSLRTLLNSMIRTLSAVGHFSILLFIFLFIYAILGMQLFGGNMILPGETEPPRHHFDDFVWAFISVFHVISGEDWDIVMYDAMFTTHWTASLYFITLSIVGQYILLNLFIAVLLSNFLLKPVEDVLPPGIESAAALELVDEDGDGAFITPEEMEKKKVADTSNIFYKHGAKRRRHVHNMFSELRLRMKMCWSDFFRNCTHVVCVQCLRQKSEYEWASLPKENTDVDEDWDDSSLIQGRSLSNVELDIIRRRSSSSPISTDLLAHPPPLPPGPKSIFGNGFRPQVFKEKSSVPSSPDLMNDENIAANVQDDIEIVQTSNTELLQTEDMQGDQLSERIPKVPSRPNNRIVSFHPDIQVNSESLVPSVYPVEDESSSESSKGSSLNRRLLRGRRFNEANKMSEKNFFSSGVGSKLSRSFGSMDSLLSDASHSEDSDTFPPDAEKGYNISVENRSTDDDNLILLRGRSLFLFEVDNPFRQLLKRIVYHPWFDYFILLLIIGSSLTLALEEPAAKKGEDELNDRLHYVDIVFTSLFAVEMVMKIVCFGFFLHRGSYLRDSWNVLDFIVVISSIISLSLSSSATASIRIVRLLRILRPLRVISRSPALRLVVQSMIRSVPGVLNVVLISLLFWLIFGILGVQFFAGQFYSCTDDAVQTKSECLALAANNTDVFWKNSPFNFDNVGNAMLTLFEVASLEDWQDIMYTGIDARGVDLQPARDAQPAAAIFFIISVIILAYFVLNLFTGVIIDNFYASRNIENGEVYMTDSQREWVDVQRLIARVHPEFRPLAPSGRFRLFFFQIAVARWFEIFIICVIVVNMVAMMFRYRGEPDEWDLALDILNIIFTCIYVIEASIKLIGLGICVYFSDSWNIFDFFVALLSVLGSVLRFGSFASILRIFRVARVFRLIRKAKSLRALLRTLWFAAPSLLNVSVLLFLLMFIYAVLGMNLFWNIDDGEEINDYANFRSFGASLLTLLISATGEKWNGFMHDVSVQPPDCSREEGNCGSSWAKLYFVSYMVLANFLILNLLVAVIVEAFSEIGRDDLQLSPQLVEDFVSAWAQFDPTATGRMKSTDLEHLICMLDPPLGLGKKADGEVEIPRVDRLFKLFHLPIPDHNGEIHFHETLHLLALDGIPTLTYSRAQNLSVTDLEDIVFDLGFISPEEAHKSGYQGRRFAEISNSSDRESIPALGNLDSPGSPSPPPKNLFAAASVTREEIIFEILSRGLSERSLQSASSLNPISLMQFNSNDSLVPLIDVLPSGSTNSSTSTSPPEFNDYHTTAELHAARFLQGWVRSWRLRRAFLAARNRLPPRNSDVEDEQIGDDAE